MLQKGLLQWTRVSDNCALNNGEAIGAVIIDFRLLLELLMTSPSMTQARIPSATFQAAFVVSEKESDQQPQQSLGYQPLCTCCNAMQPSPLTAAQ